MSGSFREGRRWFALASSVSVSRNLPRVGTRVVLPWSETFNEEWRVLEEEISWNYSEMS